MEKLKEIKYDVGKRKSDVREEINANVRTQNDNNDEINAKLISIGNNVSIGTSVGETKGVTIKDGAYVGDAVIGTENRDTGDRSVYVGNNVVINSGARIGTDTCIYSSVNIDDNVRIGRNAEIQQDVIIGTSITIPSGSKCVYIGTGAYIGKNVNINTGAMIGAGANIGMNVGIEDNVRIGQNVTLINGAVIGTGYKVTRPSTAPIIGTNVLINCNVSIGLDFSSEEWRDNAVSISTSVIIGSECHGKSGINVSIDKGVRIGSNVDISVTPSYVSIKSPFGEFRAPYNT